MPVECRPGTAAAAALVIGATIVLALRGVARTEVREAEDRAAGDAIIGPRVRAWYRGLIEPMEAQLAGWGVRPDHLTYTQFVVSVLAGLALARGCLLLGGGLTILARSLAPLGPGLDAPNGATHAHHRL